MKILGNIEHFDANHKSMMKYSNLHKTQVICKLKENYEVSTKYSILTERCPPFTLGSHLK